MEVNLSGLRSSSMCWYGLRLRKERPLTNQVLQQEHGFGSIRGPVLVAVMHEVPEVDVD